MFAYALHTVELNLVIKMAEYELLEQTVLYFGVLDLYYTTENNIGTQSCVKAKTVDPIW